VRLPKEFRLPGTEVYIEKQGSVIVLRPQRKVDWEEFFDAPNPVPRDFLVNREDWKLRRKRPL
jgi:virulence-associated protein VagC